MRFIKAISLSLIINELDYELLDYTMQFYRKQYKKTYQKFELWKYIPTMEYDLAAQNIYQPCIFCTWYDRGVNDSKKKRLKCLKKPEMPKDKPENDFFLLDLAIKKAWIQAIPEEFTPLIWKGF